MALPGFDPGGQARPDEVTVRSYVPTPGEDTQAGSPQPAAPAQPGSDTGPTPFPTQANPQGTPVIFDRPPSADDLAHGFGNVAGSGSPTLKLAQNDVGSDADIRGAADALARFDGPPVAGRYDTQPAGPTNVPRGDDVQDTVTQLQQWDAKNAQANSPAPQGQQPDVSGFWNSAGSALRELPRGIANGIVTGIVGGVGDVLNLKSHFDAAYPATSLQAMAGMLDETGMSSGFAANQIAQYNAQHPQAPVPEYDPNGRGIHLPFGSEDLLGAVQHITGLDLHQQDKSILGGVLFNAGLFGGYGFSPTGIARDVSAGAGVTKTAATTLLHHLGAPAGIGAGADLAAWAAGDTPEDHALSNLVIAPLSIAARAGIGYAARGAWGAGKGIGPKAGEAIDETFKASYGVGWEARKAEALKQLQDFDLTQLPPGMEVPGGAQTSSDPIRQMLIDRLTHNAQLHNDYVTRIAQANSAAIAGMHPEGNAADAAAAARNLQTAAQNAIDMRIATAADLAKQAESVAAINSKGRALPIGGAEGQVSAFDAAHEAIGEVRAARDDTKLMTDQQWQIARDLGVLRQQATPETNSTMYGRLIAQMQEHLRAGKDPRDFPFEALSPLFQVNPRRLFDNTRTAKPEFLPSGDYPGDAAYFGSRDAEGAPAVPEPTIDQLKNADNTLAERIRQEQDAISNGGNRGNRLLLKNLVEARQPIWDAIQTTAKESQNPLALATAMDTTALYHQTFSGGVIGDLLAKSPEDYGQRGNPLQVLSGYLGNTGNAIANAEALRNVMFQRTGAAEAARGMVSGTPGALPAQQFANTWADYLRQDYLNAHSVSQGNARDWLRNRAGFFDTLGKDPQVGQTFSDLHNELSNYNRMAYSELPAVMKTAAEDKLALSHSALQEFMGGEAGPRLDAILKSDRPGAEMDALVHGALERGDGGRALDGLRSMMFHRLLTESYRTDPYTGQQTFSSTKAAQWLSGNAHAYAAIGRADPGWVDRLTMTMRAFQAMDRMYSNPHLILPKSATPGAGMTQDIATMATQIAAAKLATHSGIAGHTGLQGPALASAFAKRWLQPLQRAVQNMVGRKDPFTAAGDALNEAIMDPTGKKLEALMSPAAATTAPAGASGPALQPWERAAGLGVIHSILTGNGAPGGAAMPQPGERSR